MVLTEGLSSELIVHWFADAGSYNAFLKDNDVLDNSRAISFIEDRHVVIGIDTAYYKYWGIHSDQMQAIVEHELAESTAINSNDPNPHRVGAVAEYQWIADEFGIDGDKGLKAYHARLCNLMGGINDTRNKAFAEVLETYT